MDQVQATALLRRSFPGAVVVEEKPKPFEFKPDIAAVRGLSGCERPIQLAGTVTNVDGEGEITGRADELAYASCKTRRKTLCEPCSVLYQHDARHLVAAGLVGGKGAPADVAQRPALFVTLTAPGFGEVHGKRGDGGKCHPRRDAEICPHGRKIVCWDEHGDKDPKIGQPLCAECFNYEGAVLWNNACSSLWRLTRIGIDRAIARRLQAKVFEKTGNKISLSKLSKNFKTSYVRCAEFQARGLVHFHSVIRLDPKRRGRPAPLSADELAEVIEQVVRSTVAEAADGSTVAWGQQLDIDQLPEGETGCDGEHENHDHDGTIEDTRPVDDGKRQVDRPRVARYLAKYATKGSDLEGKLDRRFKDESDLEYLRVNDHLARMVRTAWKLARKFPDARLDHWSHQLGYRGHFLTKSRYWSTTFKALRQVRIDHQRAKRQESIDALSPDSLVVAKWQFVGQGYRNASDDLVAEAIRNKNKQRQQQHSQKTAA